MKRRTYSLLYLSDCKLPFPSALPIANSSTNVSTRLFR
jgi:hypothetical protein